MTAPPESEPAAESTPGTGSTVCHFVIDCSDLDRATEFWSRALDATVISVDPQSVDIYRKLKLPNTEVCLLLQRTDDPSKAEKARMHLDFEAVDVDAEVERLESIGASRVDHQVTRGWDFWVLVDPDGNEFCVLPKEQLDERRMATAGPAQLGVEVREAVDWRQLRSELTGEDGDDFMTKVRTDLVWDKEAFRRLEILLRGACQELENAEHVERWLVEGAYFVFNWLPEFSGHPNFPKPENYEEAIERLRDLQYWFSLGESPRLPHYGWEPID